MTYTCAVYPTPDATLEEAQHAKYELVARKLALRAGKRGAGIFGTQFGEPALGLLAQPLEIGRIGK